MAAVWFCLRSQLRARWRAWLGLSLLVGLFGGVALGAAAGARRTESAYPRFLAGARAADVLISPQRTGLGGFYDEVDGLPEVAALAPVAGMQVGLVTPSGRLDPAVQAPAAAADGRLGVTVHRPNLLAGRMPRPDRAHEVLAARALARQLRLDVGSRITLRDFSHETFAEPPTRLAPSQGTPVTFTVVGIGVFPEDVVPTSQVEANRNSLLLTPAFLRAHADLHNLAFDGALVRLRPDADAGRFRDEVQRLARRHLETGTEVFFATYADQYAGVQRAIRPQAVALAVFALLSGAAALLVIGQALSRQLALAASDHPTMRALGITGPELFAVAMVPAAAVTLLGAVLAVALAVLSSPLMPIGPARLAELHSGLSVNVAVLGGGVLAMALVLLAAAALPAWRSARSGAVARRTGLPVWGRPSRSRLAAAVGRAGLPPTVGSGVRMALEPGEGRTAVPVRGALVGTAVAVATVVAATTFAANLSRLVRTPGLYGWDWDLAVDAQFAFIPADEATALLRGTPGVAGFSGGNYGNVTIGGKAVATVGIDTLRGSVFPTLARGRAPGRSDEIVLGAHTLRRAHRGVGDVVDVHLASGQRPMRIVGEAVFPALGRGGFPPTSLGDGAAVTSVALAVPDVPPGSYNFFLVRYRPGADGPALSRRITHAVVAAGCPPLECGFFHTRRPADINNYARVRWTPLLLAGLLGVLALCTMGHALVTSVRRRRRDLAVLKAIGFGPGQVSATVAWQATTLAGLALAAGLPLGVAAGRWTWNLFAAQLGVAAPAGTPPLAVLLTVPVAVLAANLVAAVPARSAARTQPALILRSE